MDRRNNDLYFDRTFENVIERMLGNYDPSMDQREGSIAWDLYSPMAIELVLLYIQLSWQWEQMFGDTAQRDSLIRLARDRNIEIMPASQARVKGEFNIKIDNGQRFNYEDLNYIVVDFLEEKESLFYYELLCESPGEEGNLSGVDIVPINNISGLKKAKLVEVLVPGEDEEDTENFRERYYHSLRHKDYGFNISEYVHQVNLMPGVGAVRCYPATPDPGKVTLYILDSEYRKASDELIKKIQEELDPVPYKQKGLGRVPIGHYVIVKTAEEEPININLKVLLANGKTLESYKDRIKNSFEKYLESLRKSYEGSYNPVDKSINLMVVREAMLEASILDINKEDPGAVLDVSVEAINGQEGNLSLGGNSIPILGEISYG